MSNIKPQKKENNKKGGGTEALIHASLHQRQTHTITKDPRYLDDEKLPERERIHVLKSIFHRNIRQKQIQRLAKNLATILEGTPPPNLLVYGPSGAGKSVTCLHFLSTLKNMAKQKNTPFHYYYLDLTTPRTCFGALNELAIALDHNTRRYRKGIALEHMQEYIIHTLQQQTGLITILIDEADNITTDADLFLTFLAKTLPKRVQARLSYIFLTNRVEWEKNLDPRILSVLKKQDLIFEPYDALDLVEILKLRVEKALHPQRVEDSALNKIAGLASRETGDARKAVELLAKAVGIAEDHTGHLTETEVDQAAASLEQDKTQELISGLAFQQKLALKACYLGLRSSPSRLYTGAAYRYYTKLCTHQGHTCLSQRRFSDMISFLDIYGLINAPVISKGRYGKTRALSGALPPSIVGRLIQEEGATSLTQYLG